MKISKDYSLHKALYGSGSLLELSWPQKSQLIESYFNGGLISETQSYQAKLLIEGIWDKITSAVKWSGGKVLDFTKWVGS